MGGNVSYVKNITGEKMEKEISSGLIFEFGNNTKLPDPGVEKADSVKELHLWLKNIFQAKIQNKYNSKLYEIAESITAISVTPLGDCYYADRMDHTHVGLIQYLFTAWAQELGVVLKPDMLFYTIISEIKNYIILNPNDFRDLFTVSKEKMTLVVVDLTPEKLMAALEQMIPSKELFDVVTKTTFSTSPDHYLNVLAITMADMGTPYYDYCTSRCGIPKMSIMGDKKEWQKLLDAVEKLQNVFKSNYRMTKYLNNVSKELNQFVKVVFNSQSDETIKEYLRNILIYMKDPDACHSGHDQVITDGWIKKFYMENYSYINEYSSHLNCLPYEDKDDPNNIKYYYYACGLSSSRILDGFLYPEYNIVHCEIKHSEAKTIFNALSAK